MNQSTFDKAKGIVKECTSFDISKRLEKLGVTQESYFIRWRERMGCEIQIKRNADITYIEPSEYCATFTVGTLGEVLRELSIQLPDWNFQGGFQWRMCLDYGDFLHLNGNEADARAEVLIWHVLNGLASVGQINEILERILDK
jgi:hypothetical protein